MKPSERLFIAIGLMLSSSSTFAATASNYSFDEQMEPWTRVHIIGLCAIAVTTVAALCAVLLSNASMLKRLIATAAIMWTAMVITYTVSPQFRLIVSAYAKVTEVMFKPQVWFRSSQSDPYYAQSNPPYYTQSNPNTGASPQTQFSGGGAQRSPQFTGGGPSQGTGSGGPSRGSGSGVESPPPTPSPH